MSKNVNGLDKVEKFFNECFNSNLDQIAICEYITILTISVLIHNQCSLDMIKKIFLNSLKQSFKNQRDEIEKQYRELSEGLELINE